MCKRIRPIIDFPLDRASLRAYTCSVCHIRRRDSYRRQRGKPVSKEGQVRQFARARQVIEKVLRARLQKEKIRRRWQERREQWAKGESWGMVQREIESFMLQDEHWLGPLSREDFMALEESWKGVPRDGEGPTGLQELRTALYKKREYARAAKWCWDSPYRHWEGWTNKEGLWEEMEGFASMGSGYIGSQEKREGLRIEESLAEGSQGDTDREESWEGLTDEEGSCTGLQDGWGGFPGENEAREGPRGERGSSASRSEAWESSQVERESFAGESEAWEGPQEIRKSPQEQYCSSCNRKKPLTDFGRFFTCNACRERNKKANRARYAKQKAKYLNKSS